VTSQKTAAKETTFLGKKKEKTRRREKEKKKTIRAFARPSLELALHAFPAFQCSIPTR